MKTARLSLPCLFLFLAAAFSLLSVPGSAAADVIDKLAQISDYVHPYNSSFPTYNDVEGARGLIQCIADGGNSFQCVQQHGGGQNQYVDTVITLANMYQEVDQGDVVGIISVVGQWLGDDAPCIIVDIITGGGAGDLCNLVKAIVEVAVKAAEAVLDFLVGLGEAVWDGLKAAAEAACEVFTLGMGDCGDDNSVPWYVLAYQIVFAPRIGDGVAAREGVTDTFKDLLAALKAQTLATKVGLGMGFTQSDADMAGNMFTAVVEAAWSGDIVNPVGGKLWALNKQRETYFADQQIMAQMVAEAVKEYSPGMYIWKKCTADFRETYKFAFMDRWINWPVSDPNVKAAQKKVLSNSKWCSDEYEYKHRPKEFAAMFSDYVDKNLCKKIAEEFVCPSEDNRNACARIMGNGVSWEAGQRCGLKPATCQVTGSGSGQYLACQSLDDYKSCLGIMKGQENRCSINVQTAGMQLAAMIDAYFKQNGSTIPCQYGALDFSKSGNPNTPVSFICTRPSQNYWCNEKYNEYFGALNVPTKLVDCVLAEPADYAQLRKRVATVVQILKTGGTNNLHSHGTVSMPSATAAVGDKKVMVSDALKTAKGKTGGTTTQKASTKPGAVQPWKPPCGNSVNISKADPLELSAEQCVVDKVQKDPNQDFGFGPPSSKPGFDYVKGAAWNKIDGATTPVILAAAFSSGQADSSKLVKPPLTTQSPESKLKKELGGGDPVEQIAKDAREKVINPDTGMEPGTGGTKQQLQTGVSGAAVTSGAARAAGGAGATGAGAAIAGGGAAATPMSGTLPAGMGPAPGGTMAGAGSTTTPFSASFPDITAGDPVKVGGSSTGWNGTVTIDAGKAVSKNKNNSGLCEFEIEYGVRNIGAGDAGPFRAVWTNAATNGTWMRSWAPLAKGTAKNEKDVVSLKQGINTLKLVLDDLHQLKEVGVANNVFQVNVNVTGACGASVAPQSVQPAAPPVPGSRAVVPKRTK